MSSSDAADAADALQRYAAAEKSIEGKIAFALAAVIQTAEIEHGVKISELRVNPEHARGERWAQAICTIAR